MSSFLELFTEPQRELLMGSATPLELDRGQYLLRRGSPGGDLYFIVNGTLDVVDTRSTPETILATMQPGTVVGEMAFVDGSPRSADVRANEACEIRVWARDDLRGLLKREPAMSAVFHEWAARIATKRMREMNSHAMTGALLAPNKGGPESMTAREDAREIAEQAKENLIEAETRLRQDAADLHARRSVHEILDRLQHKLVELFALYPDSRDQETAASVLCREMHPYLVRSVLAERAIRRPQGLVATADILSHVLLDNPGGDGEFGELLDRWLLDRPTFVAVRTLRDLVISQVTDLLADRPGPRRVLVVNAGTGALVGRLYDALSGTHTVLTVVDQSRDALAFLDSGVTFRPGDIELRTRRENLAELAMGRGRHTYEPQDVIVLHGMIEYLPSRLAMSLLAVCRGLLAPGGSLVMATLGPSPDGVLLDRLLTWPSIRRPPEGTERLFHGSRLTFGGFVPADPPALLAVARRDPPT